MARRYHLGIPSSGSLQLTPLGPSAHLDSSPKTDHLAIEQIQHRLEDAAFALTQPGYQRVRASGEIREISRALNTNSDASQSKVRALANSLERLVHLESIGRLRVLIEEQYQQAQNNPEARNFAAENRAQLLLSLDKITRVLLNPRLNLHSIDEAIAFLGRLSDAAQDRFLNHPVLLGGVVAQVNDSGVNPSHPIQLRGAALIYQTLGREALSRELQIGSEGGVIHLVDGAEIRTYRFEAGNPRTILLRTLPHQNTEILATDRQTIPPALDAADRIRLGISVRENLEHPSHPRHLSYALRPLREEGFRQEFRFLLARAHEESTNFATEQAYRTSLLAQAKDLRRRNGSYTQVSALLLEVMGSRAEEINRLRVQFEQGQMTDAVSREAYQMYVDCFDPFASVSNFADSSIDRAADQVAIQVPLTLVTAGIGSLLGNSAALGVAHLFKAPLAASGVNSLGQWAIRNAAQHMGARFIARVMGEAVNWSSRRIIAYSGVLATQLSVRALSSDLLNRSFNSLIGERDLWKLSRVVPEVLGSILMLGRMQLGSGLWLRVSQSLGLTQSLLQSAVARGEMSVAQAFRRSIAGQIGSVATQFNLMLAGDYSSENIAHTALQFTSHNLGARFLSAVTGTSFSQVTTEQQRLLEARLAQHAPAAYSLPDAPPLLSRFRPVVTDSASSLFNTGQHWFAQVSQTSALRRSLAVAVGILTPLEALAQNNPTPSSSNHWGLRILGLGAALLTGAYGVGKIRQLRQDKALDRKLGREQPVREVVHFTIHPVELLRLQLASVLDQLGDRSVRLPSRPGIFYRTYAPILEAVRARLEASPRLADISRNLHQMMLDELSFGTKGENGQITRRPLVEAIVEALSPANLSLARLNLNTISPSNPANGVGMSLNYRGRNYTGTDQIRLLALRLQRERVITSDAANALIWVADHVAQEHGGRLNLSNHFVVLPASAGTWSMELLLRSGARVFGYAGRPAELTPVAQLATRLGGRFTHPTDEANLLAHTPQLASAIAREAQGERIHFLNLAYADGVAPHLFLAGEAMLAAFRSRAIPLGSVSYINSTASAGGVPAEIRDQAMAAHASRPWYRVLYGPSVLNHDENTAIRLGTVPDQGPPYGLAQWGKLVSLASWLGQYSVGFHYGPMTQDRALVGGRNAPVRVAFRLALEGAHRAGMFAADRQFAGEINFWLWVHHILNPQAPGHIRNESEHYSARALAAANVQVDCGVDRGCGSPVRTALPETALRQLFSGDGWLGRLPVWGLNDVPHSEATRAAHLLEDAGVYRVSPLPHTLLGLFASLNGNLATFLSGQQITSAPFTPSVARENAAAVLAQRREAMTYPRGVFGNFLRGVVTYFDQRYLTDPMADLISFAGGAGRIEVELNPNRELRAVRAVSEQGAVLKYQRDEHGNVSRTELEPW